MGRRTQLRAAISGAASSAYETGLRWTNGRHREGEPPLIRGSLPFLGAAVPFGKDATEFLQQCRREHGDVFTLYVAGRRMTFVCDPLSYPAVLRCPALQFEPFTDQVMERAFDFPDIRSEVDVEGTDDAARRHLRGPDLADLSHHMSAAVLRVLDRDERMQGPNGEVDLYRMVWDVVFEAGTDVVFGAGVHCPHVAQSFQEFDRQFPALIAGMPKLATRKGRAGLRGLVGHLASLGQDPSKWMQERVPYIDQLTAPKRGRTQAAVLWATHANTIPSAFWTLAYVLSDPEATKAVTEEIDTVLGDDADRPLSRAQLDNLPIIESAAREALRLSAGSLTVRKAVEAVELEMRSGRWSIREGDQVCLAPQLTHHDPAVFENPERFQYDRFADRGAGRPRFELDGERAGYAFMVFGAGKHTCPGRFFAVNEIKVLVTSLLRRYRFERITEPLPDFERRRIGLGIFPPAQDIRVRWSRREPVRSS